MNLTVSNKAFRISKDDLQTRPIFNYKEGPIKLDLLICFMALVRSERIKPKKEISMKSSVHKCKRSTDAGLKIKVQGIMIRANPTFKILELLKKLDSV